MSEPIRIRWHYPTAPQIDRARSLSAAVKPRAIKEMSLDELAIPSWRMPEGRRELLSRVGIPVPEAQATAREYTVALLKIASEVEHALMVQYLYAAAALDPTQDVSQENYIVKVMRVAIQEMGHLATVQNLLLLVGGPDAIHMQRDTVRTSSDLRPIPFVLEPLSRPAIAKFVAAEMPAVIPSARVLQVAELLTLAKKDSGVEPHRVGAIYSVLRWLFLPSGQANDWLDLTTLAGLPPDLHLTDADLTGAGEMDALEGRIDEWGADMPDFILAAPRTCGDAIAAIDRVSEQGEGWDAAEDSHFAEFLEMADAWDAGRLDPLIRKVVKSPTLTKGFGGEKGVLITHPYTKAWGAVFSLQYTLLVLSIQHALTTRRSADGDPGLREGLAALSVRAMRKVIPQIAAILTALPVKKGKPALAGPPYDLDPSALEPAGPEALRARHLEHLDRMATVYAQIEADPEFSNHAGHDIAIANLRNFDDRRRALFAS